MSLLKQLFLAICLFLVVAFTGSFIASVENSRDHSISQLRSHAQDAATALALSMTPHVDDPVMIELMVNSIFDSGYFSSIRVIAIPDERPVVSRSSAPVTETVPYWFARLVALPPQAADALMMRGWEQAARVEVISHPQFALAKLWDSAVATLLWLLLCGLFSALLGGWLLRIQLRPLDDMVDQAQAISQREFLTLPGLPRIPELKRVVLAMNQMVEKLKALFAEEAARSERLRQAAYQDELTGLANRRLLDSRLASQLAASEHNADGHLLMLQINDLSGLNQRHGGAYSDRLIILVGELLNRIHTQFGRPDWLAARSRGSEFVLLAPGTHADEAGILLAEVQRQLEALRATGASDCTPVAHIGLASFQQGESAGAVLGRADQSLARAQAYGTGESASTVAQPLTDQYSWHQLLDDALANGTLDLFLQPVALTGSNRDLLHHKVLARIRSKDGESIVAGQFLPWIERLGWGARFDQVVLEQVIRRLQQAPQSLALSLSATTLRDPQSRQAILQQLRTNPEQARLLSLELDARYLAGGQELQQWSQNIRSTGARLGLQHFGGQFSHIGNLTHLGLAYLKIDGAYIRNIDQDGDKRIFIEAIYRTTNSIDLPLIAEMVETEGELRVLAELGVRGAMGHLIGAPGQWETPA